MRFCESVLCCAQAFSQGEKTARTFRYRTLPSVVHCTLTGGNGVRAGKRFGKQLARPNGGKQIAVAPEILLQDLGLAGQDDPGG